MMTNHEASSFGQEILSRLQSYEVMALFLDVCTQSDQTLHWNKLQRLLKELDESKSEIFKLKEQVNQLNKQKSIQRNNFDKELAQVKSKYIAEIETLQFKLKAAEKTIELKNSELTKLQVNRLKTEDLNQQYLREKKLWQEKLNTQNLLMNEWQNKEKRTAELVNQSKKQWQDIITKSSQEISKDLQRLFENFYSFHGTFEGMTSRLNLQDNKIEQLTKELQQVLKENQKLKQELNRCQVLLPNHFLRQDATENYAASILNEPELECLRLHKEVGEKMVQLWPPISKDKILRPELLALLGSIPSFKQIHQDDTIGGLSEQEPNHEETKNEETKNINLFVYTALFFHTNESHSDVNIKVMIFNLKNKL
ncbi:hypothetical protein RFI_11370 [Reticulomyxa filosa]|uniref:Uncharacterized protein n=1 Tax=Reticulomyxa filosa TaxID=46433 RepID=X6NJ48_RETFI|nr:hypothetical protein RFI_11370 [Reticulomyxa filosa]|eukprot:ETO25769.1 hypothetical protein RFI_11370 [Reticulomyxa filosa]